MHRARRADRGVSPARRRRQAEAARGGTVAGRRAALEAVRAGLAQEVLVARGSRSTPALQDLLDAATERRVPVREASRRELDAFARDHHGVVALVEATPELSERHLACWPFGEEDAGFSVVGLDEGAEATVYDRPCPPGRVALVVGSEGEGLSRLTRESCDALVRLPMRGRVASLNAAASLAAVLYAFVLPSRRS